MDNVEYIFARSSALDWHDVDASGFEVIVPERIEECEYFAALKLDDETVVALATLAFDPDFDAIDIDFIEVHPDYRGDGYAKQLLRKTFRQVVEDFDVEETLTVDLHGSSQENGHIIEDVAVEIVDTCDLGVQIQINP